MREREATRDGRHPTVVVLRYQDIQVICERGLWLKLSGMQGGRAIFRSSYESEFKHSCPLQVNQLTQSTSFLE